MIRNSNFHMSAPLPPTYWTGELVEKGQWVKGLVKTPFGLIWHHGIIRRVVWTGNGWYVEVIHNVKDGGVIVSSLDAFADGVIHLKCLPSSPEHAASILAIADANFGKPYATFAQNCEHFCTFCYTGEAKSETVQALAGLAAVAGVVGLAVFRDGRPNRRA